MSDLPEPPVVPVVKVDWYRSLTGWYPMVRTLPLSWRATWLIPALVGYILSNQAWELASQIFSQPVSYWGSTGPQDFEIRSPWNTGYIGVWKQWFSSLTSVVGTGASPGEAWTWQKAAAISFGSLASLAIWSFIGGWITRRSVVELGTRSTEDWGTTWQLVTRRWLSFAFALLSPIIIALSLLIITWLIGTLGRAGGIGVAISSILMIPALLLLFPITRVLINWAGGIPLLFAAVATEKKADGFEGFSRGFAYISQAPVPMAICVLLAQLISYVGESILFYGFGTAWSYVAGSYIWGIGQNNATNLGLTATEQMPLWMIAGNNAAFYLARAFCFSYFFTASAAIYLIMRNTVDQTDIDQIDLLDREPSSELAELPPPGTDAAKPQDSSGAETAATPTLQDNKSGETTPPDAPRNEG